MRVVYYSHTAFFEVALSMASALAEVAEVHLVLETTPTSWRTAGFDVPPLDLPSGLIDADAHLAPYFPPGVRARWTGLASFTLASHRTHQSVHPKSVRVGLHLLSFARRVGADVLHIDDVDVTPRLALALPTHRATPIVLSVHDPAPHSGEGGWRKTLARRLAFPRADRFVLHNHSLAREFARANRLAEHRIDTIRLGALDLLRAWLPEPAPERGPRLVSFTGRISPYKGIDVLYSAIPSIARAVPGVRFRIAGRPVPGYTLPGLPEVPAGTAIEHDLRYQSNGDLAALLAGSALIVCPYRDATQSAVVLSAFGFDTPVVASDTGGLREYVDDGVTGVLVPPADANALADAIIGLLKDPRRLDQMSRAIARSRASEGLSFRRAASELIEVYARATG